MPEVIAWPEGKVWIWTGTAGSALLAFAQNSRAFLVRGYDNYSTLDGVYHNVETGRRADVQIESLLTTNATALQVLFDAATATHVHMAHAITGGGSAGHRFWTGRIDYLVYQGQVGDLYKYQVAYHSNVWSAY